MEHDTRTRIMASYLAYPQKKRPSISSVTLLGEASARFEESWRDPQARLFILGGKEFISALSTEVQRVFGCSITLNQLLDEYTSDEVSEEISGLLNNIAEFLS